MVEPESSQKNLTSGRKPINCGSGRNCGNLPQELHSCPYSEEINNNYNEICTCCNECRRECCYDI